jgi:hypothetical protein
MGSREQFEQSAGEILPTSSEEQAINFSDPSSEMVLAVKESEENANNIEVSDRCTDCKRCIGMVAARNTLRRNTGNAYSPRMQAQQLTQVEIALDAMEHDIKPYCPGPDEHGNCAMEYSMGTAAGYLFMSPGVELQSIIPNTASASAFNPAYYQQTVNSK